MEFLSKKLEDTKKIAHNFADPLEDDHQGAIIVGLYGELGSGKTTFMKYLAECFGIKETIKSPTFIIMKKFQIPNSKFQNLIHIDAYRIEKEEEMINLEWNEIIADPKNLICIEWADKIAGIMPPHIVIKFEHGDKENERKIIINKILGQ